MSNDFVYYLVISSLVREPAIKSMVGSSGRQRVQQTVIDELEVPNYSLAEQQHIVDLVTYLLILLILFFAEQKFSILMKSGLSIISFMDHILMMNLKRHHRIQDHLGFFLCYFIGSSL